MLELFYIFLRLGAIGFGGPIALVALMEQTVCNEKKWLTTAEFAEIFSVCKLLPGPLAVQVAIYIGYKRYGRIGGLITGIAFNAPAVLFMLILSILYTHGTTSHNTKNELLFKFMQDSTLAIIILALWSMAKGYINSLKMVALTILGGIIIFFLPTYEPLIIISFGLIGIIVSYKNNSVKLPILVIPSIKIGQGLAIGGSLLILSQMLWIFFKAGEFSFGTGLAIIPLLHGDLVTKYHWLTDKQFLDGVMLGQITPGPTTVSVVFFGYKIAGFMGVLIALIGFYLPAFINTLVFLPILWNRLVNSPRLKYFIMFAFPAIIGGIVSASLKIGAVTVTNWYDWILLIIAIIIIGKKILPIWSVIPLYGLLGFLVSFF